MKKRVWIAVAVCILAAMLPTAYAKDCWYKEKNGDHDWEQVDVKLPGCETDGSYTLECRQCGKNKTVVTEKAYGHNKTLMESVAATCTKTGYKRYVCESCGKTIYREIPAAGHKYKDVETLEIATCQQEGSMRTRCTVCNQVGLRTIKKSDHKYGAWTITVAATDHSMGSRTHKCTTCGKYQSEDFYPDGTLYRGMSKNDEVKELQRMLIDLEFLKDKADGIFGKKTEQAVKDYQKWASLDVTGIAYPQTINALGCSWDEKMAPSAAPTELPTPTPTEAPAEYPPCCTATADENDGEHSRYCELHDAIRQAEAQMLAEARTDAAVANARKIVRSMWSAELDSLYENWRAAASAEELPRIASDQALFLAMLSSQEGLMKNRGASQQAMDEKIAALLMEQCAYVCAEMYAQSAA